MRVSLDLERVRSETPACADRIHLNNAGAALMPAPVYEAIVEHLGRERELGGYGAADEARPDIERAYSDVARVVGAHARNIAIVENASVAFTQAIASFDRRVVRHPIPCATGPSADAARGWILTESAPEAAIRP